ncbi:MAG: hypothetical protein HYW27_02410 [Candidatus Aenigmarchaeota archaeon]|nr:hypothetical protein [Candidatus Aenigmarchaeota archaeon]
MHYTSVGIEPVEAEVRGGRRALPYLRRLLDGARELADGFDEPTQRINLLFDGAGVPEIYLSEILGQPVFDFFIAADYREPQRFRCYDRRAILHGSNRINKTQRVADLFGDARHLELTHIGSPGAGMTDTDDYDIIDNIEDEHDRVCREQIRLALSTYTRDTEHLADEDIDAAAVLCLVAETGQDGTYVGRDEVVDFMDSGYLDLHCQCYDYETDEISRVMDSLVDRGLLEEDDEGLTVAACHRIGKKEETFTNPDQMELNFGAGILYSSARK